MARTWACLLPGFLPPARTRVASCATRCLGQRRQVSRSQYRRQARGSVRPGPSSMARPSVRVAGESKKGVRHARAICDSARSRRCRWRFGTSRGPRRSIAMCWACRTCSGSVTSRPSTPQAFASTSSARRRWRHRGGACGTGPPGRHDHRGTANDLPPRPASRNGRPSSRTARETCSRSRRGWMAATRLRLADGNGAPTTREPLRTDNRTRPGGGRVRG